MVKQNNKEEKIIQEKKIIKKEFIFAVGRRRESVARVRLYSTIKDGMIWGETVLKKGEIIVNQKPIDQYFSSKADQVVYREPLRVTNALNRYALTISVEGGGMSGQLGAVIHGIARVLEKADEKYRPILKKRGYLTRDARVRERRKVGTGGKARRAKQSPKR